MKTRTLRLAVLGSASLTLLSLPAWAQSTWYVDVAGSPPGNGSQSSPYTSLQFAIDQATTLAGDTLLVAAGTYYEKIDYMGKNIVIDGSAANPDPTIHAESNGTAVTFKRGEGPSAVLRGFRLTRGTGTLYESALAGGGVFVLAASPRLEQVRIEGNTANYGGGLAAYAGASPELVGCIVANNSVNSVSAAGSAGGGMFVSGSNLRFTDGECNANAAKQFPASGAGVHVASGAFFASNSMFSGNRIEANGGLGGAIFAADGVAVANLSGCQFQNNGGTGSSVWGVGGGAVAGSIRAIGCSFSGNHFVLQGGAAYGGVYEECTFSGNQAQRGGALSTGAVAYRSSIVNNLAIGDGGFDGRGGALEFSQAYQCVIANNVASGDAGAAYSSVLEDCEVLFNSARAGPGNQFAEGGGLMQSSALRCNIRGNIAMADSNPQTGGLGGGAYNSNLIDCRLSINQATRGGGAYNASPALGFYEGCSFAANIAQDAGGAIFNGSTSISVLDSILWGNMPQELAQAAGGTWNVTHSIVQGGFSGVGNLASDPLWFGPTGTDLHLKVGSPAIDAGNPNSAPDPDGSPADMGAIPYDPNWTG